KSPIALGLQVTELQLALQAELDARRAAGNLAGDEVLTAPRRFVIEKNTVDRIQAVGFAIVAGLPVGVDLGAGVWTARMEGRAFGLRYFGGLTKHLGGARLIETHRSADALVVIANRLEQPQ